MPIMLRPAPTANVFCATLFRVMSASLETGSGRERYTLGGHGGLMVSEL